MSFAFPTGVPLKKILSQRRPSVRVAAAHTRLSELKRLSAHVRRSGVVVLLPARAILTRVDDARG
jgi:hypothetical protein